MVHRLSKSRVLNGLQCHRYLWWRVHEPHADELVPDSSLRARLGRGSEVGEVAREYVPGGVLIDRDRRGIEGALEDTRAAMGSGATVLYEAAFVADDVFVAVDILRKVGAGWSLIEVKSATGVKDEYIPDVAIQMHVLTAAGLDVVSCEVMTLNRECVYPDLSNLFVRHDVTEEAAAYWQTVSDEIPVQLEMLAGGLPEVEIGDHCRTPYECPFLERCWPERPEHHITTLYFGGKRAREWEAAGCETILDIPDHEALSEVQARQALAVAGRRLICEAGLADALAALPEPVGYLDFETLGPPIPCWNGCRPYDQVPAQFVCYVRDEEGEPSLREWLAEGGGDPRPQLARHLVEACRDAAVILAWYASFEVGCVRRLAEAVPDLAEDLLDIADRIVDLLPIVRNHVYHPDFGGGFSLKAVLPALVPELTYENLEIQGGVEASLVLEQLVLGPVEIPAEERARLREALQAYCRLDTWGMVRLHDRLRELARHPTR